MQRLQKPFNQASHSEQRWTPILKVPVENGSGLLAKSVAVMMIQQWLPFPPAMDINEVLTSTLQQAKANEQQPRVHANQAAQTSIFAPEEPQLEGPVDSFDDPAAQVTHTIPTAPQSTTVPRRHRTRWDQRRWPTPLPRKSRVITLKSVCPTLLVSSTSPFPVYTATFVAAFYMFLHARRHLGYLVTSGTQSSADAAQATSQLLGGQLLAASLHFARASGDDSRARPEPSLTQCIAGCRDATVANNVTSYPEQGKRHRRYNARSTGAIPPRDNMPAGTMMFPDPYMPRTESNNDSTAPSSFDQQAIAKPSSPLHS